VGTFHQVRGTNVRGGIPTGLGEGDSFLAAVNEQVRVEHSRHDLLEERVQKQGPQERHQPLQARLVELV